MEDSKTDAEPRFALGTVVTTPGVLALFGEDLERAMQALVDSYR